MKIFVSRSAEADAKAQKYIDELRAAGATVAGSGTSGSASGSSQIGTAQDREYLRQDAFPHFCRRFTELRCGTFCFCGGTACFCCGKAGFCCSTACSRCGTAVFCGGTDG